MTKAKAKAIALQANKRSIRRRLRNTIENSTSGFGVAYMDRDHPVFHIGLGCQQAVDNLILSLALRGLVGVGFRTRYEVL